jgi:hypothetical protein
LSIWLRSARRISEGEETMQSLYIRLVAVLVAAIIILVVAVSFVMPLDTRYRHLMRAIRLIVLAYRSIDLLHPSNTYCWRFMRSS